jgi:hypothetical protein
MAGTIFQSKGRAPSGPVTETYRDHYAEFVEIRPCTAR